MWGLTAKVELLLDAKKGEEVLIFIWFSFPFPTTDTIQFLVITPHTDQKS